MKTVTEIESILGQLVITGSPTSSLPLQKTTIEAQVQGMIHSTIITQQFSNPFSQPLELTYLFPLSHTAAITGFDLQIDQRTITGDVQELEQARQAYAEAVENGQRAGLLEQRRPNLFAVRLGNVMPAETIQASMHIQDRVHFEDGTFEIVYPLGLTQRYHTGDHPEEEMATDTSYAAPGEKIGPLEITLTIAAGLEIDLPTSPSHSLRFARLDGQRLQVSLDGPAIPNKDFVLRYKMSASTAQPWIWTSQSEGGDFFLANIFPPALPEDFSAPPREFVFVLDRSGSMSGEPITQARNALRACLRSLNPADLFRILLFDDQVEWHSQKACQISQAAIDQADAFLARVEGRGGTEILAALEAVFAQPEDPQRQRYVVFLTDGAVSAEGRVLELIRRQAGKSRLFTFGIGPSVNRALLSQMARSGRGTAEFLQLDEDIEGAVIRFQDRVSFPVLTDLNLKWEGAKVWDLFPANLADLYAGVPLECSGRLRVESPAARLVLHGRRGGQPVELTLALQAPTRPEPAIERLWAKARVEDLLEQGQIDYQKSGLVRGEIINLAFKYRLVTPFTAFVAVDVEKANLDNSPRRVLQVSQPLPEGLDMAGFNPAQPSQVFMQSAPAPAMPAHFQSRTASLKSTTGLPGLGKMAREALGGGLDLPAFMRKRSAAPAPQTGNDSSFLAEEANDPAPADQEGTLRWLARSQGVDGSWHSSLEQTCAALLAFVRAGHTTRTGSFRQAVKRASAWIEQQAGSTGFETALKALALAELAQATGQPAHLGSAAAARQAFKNAATPLERAVQARLDGKPDSSAQLPENLATIADLRLAGILKISRPIDPGLRAGQAQGLVDTWAATL